MFKFPPRKSKYRNSKVRYQGKQFDSIAERDFYIELQNDSRVVEIELQPVFTLQPAFEKKGIKYKPITYRADFKVTYCDRTVKIYDKKGYETTEFKIKRKMFEYLYPTLHLELV